MGESSGTPQAMRDQMTGTVWDAYESVARSIPTTASPGVDVVVTSAEVLVRLLALYLRAPPTRDACDGTVTLEHESFLWTACGALAKLLTDEWNARDRPSPPSRPPPSSLARRPEMTPRAGTPRPPRRSQRARGRHPRRRTPTTSDALVDAAFDLLDAISHVGAGSQGSRDHPDDADDPDDADPDADADRRSVRRHRREPSSTLRAPSSRPSPSGDPR